MATKAKDSSSALRKEKKAAPSSNSHTATLKPANSKPAATTDKDKATPPSSGKSIPNYLRPTFSSRSESLKLAKKTNNEDSTQKLLRRRSFDKPPSALRAQKSLISPDPKERVSSRDRLVPNRPSSSSASRTHASRAVLERNSKSLKPLRPQQQPSAASWTVKGSKSLPKNAYSSKSPSSTSEHQDTTHDLDAETKQETNDASLVQEAQVTVNVETDEVQAERNDEDVDVVKDSQVKEGDEDEKSTPPEISTVSEKPSVSHQEVQVQETETGLIEPEHDNRYDGDHQEKEERNDNQPEEGIVDDTTKVESNHEDKEEESVNEKAVSSSEEAVEETKANNEGSQELKAKEAGEKVVESVEQGNGEVSNTMQKKQGKKESPAAYNDVIEETKNKLLEKRKNKVKALVGAFETVIDYETAAGSNK